MNAIHFNNERWEEIKDTYAHFWDKTITRPVAGVAVREFSPSRDAGNIPPLTQATCNDFTITPDQIADKIEHQLSQFAFYGDAFPMVNMDSFGPGVIAAFLGAELDNSTGNVWFHSKELSPLSEISFKYDPNNKWLCRLKDIYIKTAERFDGNVLMGMTDLGGVLDILSTFRPAEQLLFDLYDEPEEITRLLSELDIMWQKYFDELHSTINGGYTDWSTLYSSKPSYIIQSDFSYMISPDMFAKFALPSIKKHCSTLSNTVYHLDGSGELPHLDMILAIENLDAVQWIPGDGNPTCEHYIDIYKRIKAAGKQIKLPWHGFDKMKIVIKDLGCDDGIFHPMQYFETADKDYALRMLKDLNITK